MPAMLFGVMSPSPQGDRTGVQMQVVIEFHKPASSAIRRASVNVGKFGLQDAHALFFRFLLCLVASNCIPSDR